jgi:5'-3' exonuclease
VAERILLIDASSLIYPAFHVMGELKTSTGFPTGAIYGYARTVLMLLREYPSQYVAVAFDSRGPTHRHEKFSEYKAHRPAMDEALAAQIPKIKELTDALRLKKFEVPGYEADDIIAALVPLATAQGLDVLIVSGDKDLLQLVGDGVRVLKPGRDVTRDLKILDSAGVQQYLGVRPDQVLDFLALVGDSVDNVPGVPGIGEKTAQKLLSQFPSLEALLENLDKVEPKKLSEKLKAFQEQARLSRELVQLNPPPLDVSLEECRAQPPDLERLRALLEELEFRSLLQELALAPTVPPPAHRAPTLALEIVLHRRAACCAHREIAECARNLVGHRDDERRCDDGGARRDLSRDQAGSGLLYPPRAQLSWRAAAAPARSRDCKAQRYSPDQADHRAESQIRCEDPEALRDRAKKYRLRFDACSVSARPREPQRSERVGAALSGAQRDGFL